MSLLTRTRKLQIGLHSSTSDITSTPSTLKFQTLVDPVLIDPNYNYKERKNFAHCDGEPLAGLKTNKMTDGIPDMKFEFIGLDTAAADGVSSSTADFPLAEIFEAHFSSVLDGAGCTGAVTPETGTSLDVGSASGSQKGGGLLIEALDGEYVFREIGGASGATFFLDRAIMEKDGTVTTAAASANIYGSRSYFINNSTPNHKHLYLEQENEDWRRAIYGALGNLTFDFSGGDTVQVNMTGINYSDFADLSGLTGNSCATPSGGDEIPVMNIRTLLDTTPYEMFDFSLDLKITLMKRKSDGAANNTAGFVVGNVLPEVTFKLRAGTLTNPHETTDAILETLRGNDTVDFSVQFGSSPKGCLGIRIPALDIRAARVDDDGQEIINCTGHATSPTQDSSTFGGDILRLHVF